MEVVGVPVIILKNKDKISAFLNACRHRGTALVEPGTGNQRRFLVHTMDGHIMMKALLWALHLRMNLEK